MKKYLVYTFADDYEYCLYGLCLFKSINETNRIKPDFRLYIPTLNKSVLDFLQQYSSDLKALNIAIVPCSNLLSGHTYSSIFNFITRKYPNDFVKILGLGETAYDYAMFLDADMLVTGDIFGGISTDFGYTDGPASPLNSGFLAFKPNHDTFTELLNWVNDRSFNFRSGWKNRSLAKDHSYQQWCQGLLYAYYCTENNPKQRTKCLSRSTYNCQHLSTQTKNTRVLHFTAAGKPLNYMFANTKSDEWILHADWHIAWLKTATTLNNYSEDSVKYQYIKKKSPLRRLMYQINSQKISKG